MTSVASRDTEALMVINRPCSIRIGFCFLDERGSVTMADVEDTGSLSMKVTRVEESSDVTVRLLVR